MELFCILAVVVILYIKIHRTVHGKKNPVVLYYNVKHNIKRKANHKLGENIYITNQTKNYIYRIKKRLPQINKEVDKQTIQSTKWPTHIQGNANKNCEIPTKVKSNRSHLSR